MNRSSFTFYGSTSTSRSSKDTEMDYPMNTVKVLLEPNEHEGPQPVGAFALSDLSRLQRSRRATSSAMVFPVEGSSSKQKKVIQTKKLSPSLITCPKTLSPRKRSSVTSQHTAASSSPLSSSPHISASTEEHDQEKQRRRRSSRKSINGLIIEFDIEDEDETELYANCEDCKEDLRPSLTRGDSSDSLEELRTNLEALEYPSSQVVATEAAFSSEHHQVWNSWGYDCVQKQMLEALETMSSHSRSSWTTVSTVMSSVNPSLTEIPEDGEEEIHDDDEEEIGSPGSFSCQTGRTADALSRRSTIRSSICGQVLEYDWNTDESDEDSDDDSDDEGAGEGRIV